MEHYFVNNNAQSNGDHEVHKENCNYIPNALNRKYLGLFFNCYDAVIEAKKTFQKSNGCKYCCNACHTS